MRAELTPGKTYCPKSFYCVNNGQSCCLVGQWCPLSTLALARSC